MLPKLDPFKFAQTYKLDHTETGHHHCHQGWIQFHCPFCTDGQHGYHLGFSIDKGNWNCWRCGGHGSWKVVGGLLKTSRSDLIMEVFRTCADTQDHYTVVQLAREARKLVVPPGLGPLAARHSNYLRSRGFKARAVAEEWDLHGTKHLSGDWSWRVVAPVADESGRTVAYVGRTVRKDHKPKYKVSEKDECLVDPKTLIYGIHKAHKSGVLIVEGPADVWRMGPGSVALLGIDWKKEQASALREFKKRFILFDSLDKRTGRVDRNAKRRAERLARYLSMFAGDTEIVDGFDSDPGDFTDTYAKEVMRELLG